MMQSQGENFEDAPLRRRGRPTGKNRVPLSREERRARNAQYERERRNDTAEAMSQLAEAAGCEPNISHSDLLATVISQIQRAARRKSGSIEDIKRINENLESQIALLESRLENKPELSDHESISKHINKKEKKSKLKLRIKRKIQDIESSPEFDRIDSQAELRIETNSCDVQNQDESNLGYQESWTKPNIQKKPKHEPIREEFKPDRFEQFESRDIETTLHTFDDSQPEQSVSHQLLSQSRQGTDLLTDIEKGIVEQWLNCDDFLDNEAHSDMTQTRSLTFSNFFSGYF